MWKGKRGNRTMTEEPSPITFCFLYQTLRDDRGIIRSSDNGRGGGKRAGIFGGILNKGKIREDQNRKRHGKAKET